MPKEDNKIQLGFRPLIEKPNASKPTAIKNQGTGVLHVPTTMISTEKTLQRAESQSYDSRHGQVNALMFQA